MPVVEDDVQYPTGTVAAFIPIRIRTLAPKATDEAYVDSQNLTIIGWRDVETDANGHWEKDLIATDDLTPAGAVYQAVAYQDEQIIYDPVFTVPTTTGPHWVGDNLTSAPQDLEIVPWTALTLEAGWSTVANWTLPRSRKIGTIVYVEGLVQNTSGSTKPAVSTVAQLPAGSEPPANVGYAGVASLPYCTEVGMIRNQTAVAANGFLSLQLIFSTLQT